MSVVSWILLILFLLVAGSAIVILIIDLFIEDPNANIIPASFICAFSSIVLGFFLMISSEMTKFLGKNFYNILSCLNGRITFLRTKETIQNFFNDAKLLLSENGKLIIQVPNMDFFFKDNIKLVNLPVLESIRSKAFTSLYHEPSGIYTATLKIETGSGKLLPVLERAEVYPLKKSEIIRFRVAEMLRKVNKFVKSFGCRMEVIR